MPCLLLQVPLVMHLGNLQYAFLLRTVQNPFNTVWYCLIVEPWLEHAESVSSPAHSFSWLESTILTNQHSRLQCYIAFQWSGWKRWPIPGACLIDKIRIKATSIHCVHIHLQLALSIQMNCIELCQTFPQLDETSEYYPRNTLDTCTVLSFNDVKVL